MNGDKNTRAALGIITVAVDRRIVEVETCGGEGCICRNRGAEEVGGMFLHVASKELRFGEDNYRGCDRRR